MSAVGTALAVFTSIFVALFVAIFLPIIAARYPDGREARLKELKKYSIWPFDLR